MVTTKTGGSDGTGICCINTSRTTTTGNDVDKNAKPKPAPIKKRIVVMTTKRRRPQKTAAAKVGLQRRAVGGLPSFRARQQMATTTVSATRTTTSTTPADGPTDDGLSLFDDCELPSDCLLAIQNLHQSSQGLHIPMTQRVGISAQSSSSSSASASASTGSSTSKITGVENNSTLQVLLEFQIFQRFEEHHASTIYQELIELKRTNVIRLLHCPDSSTNTWILTRDYIAGVWDSPSHHHCHQYAQQQQQQQSQQQKFNSDKTQEILSWFVTHLKFWIESTLPESAMKELWTHKLISFDTAIQRLLMLQVLMRDTTTTTTGTAQHRRYHLWLPKWGVVLKAWSEARQQLMTFVTLKKEISERNVLSKNRHSCFSTKFLLDELVYQGKLKIVERPFGRFVQKVNYKKG